MNSTLKIALWIFVGTLAGVYFQTYSNLNSLAGTTG
jgi:hypothetical protein